MTLKEQINKDYMEAFKGGNTAKKDFLRVIKGAIQNEESKTTVTDKEVMALLKSTKKSINITIDGLNEIGGDTTEAKLELSFVDAYLPTQMDDTQVETVIAEIITEIGASSMKDMGRTMGEFNKRFGGQADGKLVSTIVKKSLS